MKYVWPFGLALRFKISRREIICWASTYTLGLEISPHKDYTYQIFLLGRLADIVRFGDTDWSIAVRDAKGRDRKAIIKIRDLHLGDTLEERFYNIRQMRDMGLIKPESLRFVPRRSWLDFSRLCKPLCRR